MATAMIAALSGPTMVVHCPPHLSEMPKIRMLSMPEPPPEKRSGKRIGGVSKRNERDPPPAPVPAAYGQDDPPPPVPASLLPIAGLLFVFFMLKGLFFPPSDSFSYSVSSYSQTTVVTNDGGSPKYETKTQSSFKTNIPGLAERLADEGRAAPTNGIFPSSAPFKDVPPGAL